MSCPGSVDGVEDRKVCPPPRIRSGGHNGGRICKPNSVCRLLPAAGRSFLWGAHHCTALATYPKVCRAEPARAPAETGGSLPIWSCSVWGLPCPAHYCAGGALLPHLFTLTGCEQPAVCFLWHFPSNGLEPVRPDVIRHTALWSSDFPLALRLAPPRQRPSDPATNVLIIAEVCRASFRLRRRSAREGKSAADPGLKPWATFDHPSKPSSGLPPQRAKARVGDPGLAGGPGSPATRAADGCAETRS